MSAPAHADHIPAIGNTLTNIADSAKANVPSTLGLVAPVAALINGIGGGIFSATPTAGSPTVGLTGPLDLGAVFTPIASKTVQSGTDPQLGPWTITTTNVGSTTKLTGPGGSSVSLGSVLEGVDASVNQTSITAPTGLKVQLPGPLGTVESTVTPFTAIGDDRVDAEVDAATTYTVPGVGEAKASVWGPGATVEPDRGFNFTAPAAQATVSPEGGGTYGVQVRGGGVKYDKDDGLEVRGPSVRVDTGDTHTELGTGSVSTKDGYNPDVEINQH